jgi:hypothetical protein
MWIVTESVMYDYDDSEVVGAYGPYESEAYAFMAREKLFRLQDEDPIRSNGTYGYDVVKVVQF